MKQSWIKRIFSFVLALVMVLGMVPAGVIHVPHAHAATDPSKYDLVIDFDYQTENNVKTPEQALELVKDESLSDMSQPVLSRSVYDGDVDELREWHKRSGLELKKFFNTSGMLYKEMKLKEKLPTMTEEEQYELLATDGMLVKRPLVVMEDKILVGFKEKEWTENLLI